MELQQLRYFSALAQLGNFTRAAEACHVSQPTLSQQIGKLELELGQSLFDRGGRSATLSEAGQALLERVEHALALLDEAKANMRTVGKIPRLRVAAIPTIAPYLLPKVLVQFATAHPLARLEVKEYTTDECLAHLTEGGLDLAILALPIRGDHLATTTLFTEELLLALPAKHRLAKKPQIRLKDLTDERFVLLHEAHCLSGQAMAFCARHALAPLVTAQLHQLGTVLELVRLGQGLSLIPAMATPQAQRKGVVFRSLSGDQPTRTVAVAWSKLRFQNALFTDFIECLRG
jgi:LysR family transcriptional regulator, hydrogen peroxide-inducible genes activator